MKQEYKLTVIMSKMFVCIFWIKSGNYYVLLFGAKV